MVGFLVARGLSSAGGVGVGVVLGWVGLVGGPWWGYSLRGGISCMRSLVFMHLALAVFALCLNK